MVVLLFPINIYGKGKSLNEISLYLFEKKSFFLSSVGILVIMERENKYKRNL